MAQSLSEIDLIDIQVGTLFVCDADGRLRYIAEPGFAEAELDPAPRLWMGRTHAGNRWRFRHDLPDSLARDLDALCRAEPIAANLAAPPVNADAIRAALSAHAPIVEELRGPAYWIPEHVTAPEAAVLLSEANAELLNAYFPWKRTSRVGLTNGPVTAAVVDGSAVSICYCARLTDQAAEAGVETAEHARGHGYASVAVAAWAAEIRQRGLLPLYSTSWDNKASQGVARKLGMICYGEDWTLW
ncbi:MAG TPA: GNAT family N-acetyltransferase [Herpetosiphonaceae bacterium]